MKKLRSKLPILFLAALTAPWIITDIVTYTAPWIVPK